MEAVYSLEDAGPTRNPTYSVLATRMVATHGRGATGRFDDASNRTLVRWPTWIPKTFGHKEDGYTVVAASGPRFGGLLGSKERSTGERLAALSEPGTGPDSNDLRSETSWPESGGSGPDVGEVAFLDSGDFRLGRG